jgi:hypothetical protein
MKEKCDCCKDMDAAKAGHDHGAMHEHHDQGSH